MYLSSGILKTDITFVDADSNSVKASLEMRELSYAKVVENYINLQKDRTTIGDAINDYYIKTDVPYTAVEDSLFPCLDQTMIGTEELEYNQYISYVTTQEEGKEPTTTHSIVANKDFNIITPAEGNGIRYINSP